MVSHQQVALVIGASKGVGLAVCRQLIKDGWAVFGTVRAAAPNLDATGIKVIEGFDMAGFDGSGIIRKLDGALIDLLVVAAGTLERDTLDTLGHDSMARQMGVNAFGPVLAVQALRHHMRPGGKVALITGKMGSIHHTGTELKTGSGQPYGELYGYKMAKAALNMAGILLAKDLAAQQVLLALVHPGVVDTDMLQGLRRARGVSPEKLKDDCITPAAAAAGVLRTMALIGSETGQCWAAETGQRLEW